MVDDPASGKAAFEEAAFEKETSKDAAPAQSASEEPATDQQPGDPVAEPAPRAATNPATDPLPRPQGPWDVEDAPEDELLDLGGMRVPVLEGFDVTVTAENDVPVVVTYNNRDGAMQVHAFAAPRSSGIWDDVRAEIVESLQEAGGRAEQASGPWGPELRAQIPVPQPDGRTALNPARFVGVDGPRWFLRALISGPVVTDANRSKPFDEILRRIVVVRGGEAMAPRDVIPLRLPREVAEAAAAQQAAADAAASDGDARPRLDLPERGPEITEVR